MCVKNECGFDGGAGYQYHFLIFLSLKMIWIWRIKHIVIILWDLQILDLVKKKKQIKPLTNR